MRFLRIPAAHALLTTCGIASLASAGIARAADTPADTTQQAAATADNGGVGEIIVTAQKRSESAQNVPVAITSLSPLTLSSSGVVDTGDLKMVTPGLTFNTNLGGFGQPRIRGIGSTATGPGIENPVATVVDGVYLGSANGAILGLSDVQQVDVLKGPQGTLFGRNATGGVIQVTTRAPSDTPVAEMNGTYGNYDKWGLNGYASAGLAKDLAVSVAGSWSEQDKGYGMNYGTGQPIDTFKEGAVRVRLRWNLDAATTVNLSADYANHQGAEPGIRSLSNMFGLNVPTPGGWYDIDNDQQPYLHTQTGGGSLAIKHAFSGLELTSTSAWRKAFFHTIIDADQTPLPLLDVDLTQRDTQFTQELQLNPISKGRFNWVLGLFYMGYQGTYDPNQTSGSFVCPYGSTTCTSATADTFDVARLHSYAGYGQGTYAIDSATNLTVGLRYTLDVRSLAENETYDGFPSGADTASRHYPKATWRVALDHRFSREVLAYVTYNRGFKSGSFEPDTYPIQPLQVETVDAFEGGLKTDLLGRKLRINVSGFYDDYTNLQANQIINGVQYVYNAPGSINYGLDLDLVAKPTHNFQIIGGLSWLHARYKQGFNTTFWSVPNPLAGGNDVVQCPSTLAEYQPCNSSGHHVQDAPDFTANIGGTYEIPTSVGPVRASVNYYYNGGYYGDAQNRIKQNAYALLDASLGWSSENDTYSVRVWSKNLANVKYTTQYDAVNFGDNAVAAPPRTYGVTLGAKY